MLHSSRRRLLTPPRTGPRKAACATVAVAALVAAVPSSPAASDPAAPDLAGSDRAVPDRAASGRAGSDGAAPGTAEPLGIGDRLYPHLGNPGYDVTAYDITLGYHRNDRPLDAVTRISARATAPLRTVNLDFTHGTVQSVDVNGSPARFTTADEDLVITPAQEIPQDEPFRITVRHTSDPRGDGNGGWVRTRDGLAMANQANAAHRVFPCNDHPSDKAVFTFHVRAPKDLTVVAGGIPLGRTDAGENSVWEYRVLHPMATELAQVSIGRSTVLHRSGPGELPVRDVLPRTDRERLAPWLAKTPAHLEWMENRVGPYPFETYGVLVADAATGFELETQTLSLFERDLFTTPRAPAWYVESVMVHELAHHWFGDSVSPRAWSDLWLNEGHATWYEALYADEHGKLPLERRMRQAYGKSDTWRSQGGPPAAPKPADPRRPTGIFRPVVYDGSALILYALRQEIGEPAFERLERQWVMIHRDSTATTGDFVRLASHVAGRDLSGFLHPWLYGAKTPPMPGHPDWKPEVEAEAAKKPTESAKKPAETQKEPAEAQKEPTEAAEQPAGKSLWKTALHPSGKPE